VTPVMPPPMTAIVFIVALQNVEGS